MAVSPTRSVQLSPRAWSVAGDDEGEGGTKDLDLLERAGTAAVDDSGPAVVAATGGSTVVQAFMDEMAERAKIAELWKSYTVAKPRMPEAGEQALDIKLRPRAIDEIVSNEHAKEEMRAHVAAAETPSVMIHGKSGTGRTSVALIMARELLGAEHFGRHGVANGVQNVLWLDGHRDGDGTDIQAWKKELLPKMEAFVTKTMHRWGMPNGRTLPEGKYKLVVLEGLDALVPTAQMELEQWLDKGKECVRLLATAMPNGHRRLVKPLQRQLVPPHVRTRRLGEHAFLLHLLSTCVRERIGYDKQGIEAVVRVSKHSLRAAYETLQHCHRRYAFVSADNMRKLFPADVPLPEFGATTALRVADPRLGGRKGMPRCRTCLRPLGNTLHRKCCESDAGLAEMAAKRRGAELPKGRGRPVCPHWRDEGACPNFNRFGRCLYDHPDSLFKVRPFEPRCPVTTLVADATCEHLYPDKFHDTRDPRVLLERAAAAKAERAKAQGEVQHKKPPKPKPLSIAQRVAQRAEEEAKAARRERQRKNRADEQERQEARRKAEAKAAAKRERQEAAAALLQQQGGGARTEGAAGGHEVKGARPPWLNSKARVIWAMRHEASLLGDTE
eukprot:g3052.t1